MNEFAINWIKGADYAEITVPSGTALKSKLLKLAEEKPDEVNHVVINKDGSMVCHAPVSYIHVSPKRKVSENRMDILDKAFISRFPIKQEMKPFSREESICMVRKFLDNIQYGTAFSDTEIQNLIGEGGDQRQIMNYTIQALAEKIAEEKIYE